MAGPVDYSSPAAGAPPIRRPRGRPYTDKREFGAWALVAAVAIGAAVGAGAALLLAPESGSDTRRAIARRVRKMTKRERRTWSLLRKTMKRAARIRGAAYPGAKIASEVTAMPPVKPG